MQTTAEKAERVVKYRLAGDVQRIGFRHFLQIKAKERDLSGFATNEQDGSLVVLLSGDDKKIGEIQPLLHQGPPGARVIAVTELLPEDDDLPPPQGFIVR